MSLFQKFTSASPDPVHPSEEPEVQSIINNLNNILNTRKDYGSPLPDFGIRDLNEYTSRDQIAHAVMGEVKRNIEQYEKRVELISITVEQSPNIFQLSFKIECRLRDQEKNLRMIFDSVFNNCYVDRWT